MMMTVLLSSFPLVARRWHSYCLCQWHVLPLQTSLFWLPTLRLPFLKHSIFIFSHVGQGVLRHDAVAWHGTVRQLSTLPVSCSFNCEITGPSPAFARRCFFIWTFCTSWHSGARHSRGNTAYNYRRSLTDPAVLPHPRYRPRGTTVRLYPFPR